jgi:mRNA interferase MazF
MVTRAAHTRWPSDHEIVELPPTGLRAASVVRFKIFTLDHRLLQRRIGRLIERDVRTCTAALDAGLGR